MNMDLNSLLRRHQLSLMIADRSMTPREKRAHEQFARDYAERIHVARDALGAGPALPCPRQSPPRARHEFSQVQQGGGAHARAIETAERCRPIRVAALRRG